MLDGNTIYLAETSQPSGHVKRLPTETLGGHWNPLALVFQPQKDTNTQRENSFYPVLEQFQTSTESTFLTLITTTHILQNTRAKRKNLYP